MYWRYELVMSSHGLIKCISPLPCFPFSLQGNLYVRWLMPLSSNPDTIWAGLRKPVQHQIKKSQKLGVQVRVAQHRSETSWQYHLLTSCWKRLPLQFAGPLGGQLYKHLG